MSSDQTGTERSLRVLILAPTGRDCEVLAQTLEKAGLMAQTVTTDMDELCREMTQGGGAAVIAGEALTEQGRQALEAFLIDEPQWSDFPLIVMDTHRPGREPCWNFARENALSHAVVLVRPIHAYALISAVRSALRARSRQYEVRDELVERRRAETALRESNERKDEFLAMLGHELRNPLAAIRNATELLKLSEPEDVRILRAHGVLERQSSHMSRLIDGLLEVSRIARGKIRLDVGTVDVGEVISESLQDRSQEIDARGLELEKDCPTEPVWVRADRVRLMQILDNLIGNAVKFTDAPGKISVTLAEEAGHAVVRIRDNGVGIRPEMLEFLFDPFSQESQDIARAAGGLGLGLFLAKGLVELQGGEIHANSEGPGSGSEFEVRLPLTKAPEAQRPEQPAVETRAQRILIVEDNADAGRSLADLLETLGHEAEVAETGSQALEVLRSQQFGLVFCDLGLPGMSGYEVAQAVRKDPSQRRLALVAVTGYGQPEDLKRTIEAGFDHHLIKPVNLEALKRTIQSVVKGSPGI